MGFLRVDLTQILRWNVRFSTSFLYKGAPEVCRNALVTPKCLLSFTSDVVGEDRAFTVLFYARQE